MKPVVREPRTLEKKLDVLLKRNRRMVKKLKLKGRL